MRTQLGLAALLVASACTGEIDSGGGGGGGGSGTPPPTDIRVSVSDGNVPQAGVRVVFADGDDVVQLDTMTDASGMVTFTMPTGNVSVYRTYPVNPTNPRPPEVYTFVGAKAGDNLVLGNSTAVNATPSAIVVDVPTSAQGTVTVTTPCGSGQGQQPNVAITVSNCPTMVPFFVQDNNNSSFYAQAAFAPNVNLASQTLAQDLQSTISANDIPANTQVNAEVDLVAGLFTLFASNQQQLDGNNGPQQVDLPNVSGVDRVVVTSINTNNMGQQMFASHSTYAASPVVIDVGQSVIPYTSNPQWSQLGLSWTETGPGNADAVIAMLDITPQQPSTITEYWRVIIAPHSGAAMPVPMLPDATMNPTQEDQISISQGLVAATGGYDAIRANAFGVDNVVWAAPMNGSTTISYSNNNPPGRVVFQQQ